MPHKHKRRQNDPSAYDLPPNLIAKPLPVRDASKPSFKNNKSKPGPKAPNPSKQQPSKPTGAATSRRKTALDDDTPRAFRRLMQVQTRAADNKKRKRASDPDNEDSTSSSSDSDNDKNDRNTRRKKPNKPATTTTAAAAVATPSDTKPDEETVVPKILPGEKLSDFAARVDREMPISGMKRSDKPASNDLPNIRETRQTKHEKHLRRLQRQWREDDVKIRDKEAAEREEREAEMEEQLELWKEWEVESGKRKAKKKAALGRKKKNGKGNDGGDENDGPDPWAKLKKKRANNPFEQAQEPPQLKKPRQVFKVRGGAKVDVANVPAAVGSLRRREELANERRNIVEEYRRLMAERRG